MSASTTFTWWPGSDAVTWQVSFTGPPLGPALTPPAKPLRIGAAVEHPRRGADAHPQHQGERHRGQVR